MKKNTWKIFALWILGTELVGLLSGLIARRGMETFPFTVQQPPLSPPAIVFPIVWTILYALMGYGAARIFLAPDSEARTDSLRIYLVQLGFNFFWSILFFNFRAFGLALAWLAVLWVLILWMILYFRKVDATAAYLQIPYLVWVSFAAYLNAAIWLLNR